MKEDLIIDVFHWLYCFGSIGVAICLIGLAHLCRMLLFSSGLDLIQFLTAWEGAKLDNEIKARQSKIDVEIEQTKLRYGRRLGQIRLDQMESRALMADKSQAIELQILEAETKAAIEKVKN